ncbi:nonsense-mediated mRNA decay factor SMG7-like [Primulina eburnea]|uniref:nonsense-mediated mRNA decay factor SMG7-like n=1 Tax=Primulina eburnea TaxID=1245227 RepID=UPI003C6C0522
MMTIPMDNNKEKGSSREGVQRLFNKNIDLENKRRKAAQARIPSDPNTWQHMRENYEAIVLEDHAFSEQHDIEYALWQLHYRRIEELRALFNAALASAGSAASQNVKGPVRDGSDRITKIRSQLKTFLSEATGFYHDLMLKIRAKYGLPLGFFSDDSDNQIPVSEDGEKSSELKKGLMSCHRCLIYLGDLARYKGLYGEGDSKARDFMAASSYYMQASSLWPSSGNPHHQLAILAGYSNDELVSIYRYFRSLAVDNPFITARDNLIIAFEKNRQNYAQLGDAKVTSVKATPSRIPGKGRGKGEIRQSYKENNRVSTNSVKERASNKSDLFKAFVTRFVRLNGILFTRTSLETFPEVFSMVKNDLLELLSSGSDEEFTFGSDNAECKLAIVRLVAIVIFTVHSLSKDNENQSYADILQRSVLLQNAYASTFEFMGFMLERCYQLNDPASSFLLPGIMVFVEWLACRHDVAVCSEMEEKQVNTRNFFWNKCISLLNKLLSSGYLFLNEDEDETCFSNMSKYDEGETANRLALPEDFELRGFLPLIPAQLILDFSRKHSSGGNGSKKEKCSRIQRIIASGKALTNVVRIGQEGFYFDTKLKEFVMGVMPEISDDYLFSSPLESGVIANSLNITMGRQMDLSAVPQFEGGVEVEDEDEDEDEVIVFKPSTTEKHFEDFASKFTSSQILASVGGAGPIGLGCENRSLSVGHDSLLVQNGISASMIHPTAFANGTSQYLQPVQTSTSKWLVEQAQTMNGLAQLHLLKSSLEDQFGTSQPATLSVSYPQFNAATGYSHPIPILEATLPSKFDSIISSGVTSDSLSMKQSSTIPSGLKKNPVSRPVRHLGPPPGFGYVPSKAADESLNTALKNENPPNPQMDDYSWLDGYHFPSSNKSVGFSNSLNLVGPTIHSVSNGNGSVGTASFPFPGKQLSALQVKSENQKSLGDYQFSENMKLYDEQQQQFHNRNQQPIGPVQQFKGPSGNQQTVGAAQQYQGQSLWDGRFFV